MAKILRPFAAIFGLAATVLLWMSSGCGNKNNLNPGDDSTGGTGAQTSTDDAGAAAADFRQAMAALRPSARRALRSAATSTRNARTAPRRR
jgi:hypothetical protein